MPLQTPLIPHCQSHLNEKLHITENLTKLKMKDNTFKSFTGYPLQDHAKYLHSPVEAPGLKQNKRKEKKKPLKTVKKPVDEVRWKIYKSKICA